MTIWIPTTLSMSTINLLSLLAVVNLPPIMTSDRNMDIMDMTSDIHLCEVLRAMDVEEVVDVDVDVDVDENENIIMVIWSTMARLHLVTQDSQVRCSLLSR